MNSEARSFEQVTLSERVQVSDNNAKNGGGVCVITGATITARINVEISRSVRRANFIGTA